MGLRLKVKVLFLDLSAGCRYGEVLECLEEIARKCSVRSELTSEPSSEKSISSLLRSMRDRGYRIYSTHVPVKPAMSRAVEGSKLKVMPDLNSKTEEEVIRELAEFVEGELLHPVEVRAVATSGSVTAIAGIVEEKDDVVVVETKVDDVSGEVLANAVEKIMEVALDVEVLLALGKKGRPSFVVRALAEAGKAEELARVIMRETGSIGVRLVFTKRIKSPRIVKKLKVRMSREYEIRVKVSGVNVKPEFEDVKRLAEGEGISLPEAYRAVYRAIYSAPK